MLEQYDLIVIGGGPAGMAAACRAADCGLNRTLILERSDKLGGILNQCIHNGFGLHIFQKDLTGPEYADIFSKRIEERPIEVKTGTSVLSISGRNVTALNSADGLLQLSAKSLVLATGCRERPAGALPITGTRPAGIMTAGTAQRLMNIEGQHIGERIVILGSGDIGLIMARRLTLEGRKVEAVIEQNSTPGGLPRNVTQCLNDFNIPLLLNSTVTEVHGSPRVESVTVASTDAEYKHFECDTLLLSVGLIPENELGRETGMQTDPATGGPAVDEKLQTGVPGIFACGNVVHVHDLVDWVTAEAELAGEAAAKFAQGEPA